MPPATLTPAMRAFIAARSIAELRDEKLWRPGEHDLPVLRRLPRLDLEIGDLRAHVHEPPPFPIVSGGSPDVEQFAAEPSWWEVAYPGGPMVPVAGFPRALYPPDAAEQGKKPSENGSDVKAYKRTISRAGRWPWATGGFDDVFSNGFAHGKSGNVSETGVAGVQRQQSISPDTGWIGEPTFNLLRSIRIPAGLANAGQPAMDGVAVSLIEDAWQKINRPPASGIEDVRRHFVDLNVRSIKAKHVWRYSQIRPMQNLGVAPEAAQKADCSTHSTDAYFWARLKTGIAVPDPNHNGYNGYGYTGTLIANPRVSPTGRHEIGDLALYGRNASNTTHVCTCYVAGTGSSSEWCSNGSDAAPYPVELRYRGDLICVVRPGLLP
jgi:hypothetical protein